MSAGWCVGVHSCTKTAGRNSVKLGVRMEHRENPFHLGGDLDKRVGFSTFQSDTIVLCARPSPVCPKYWLDLDCDVSPYLLFKVFSVS